MDTVSYRVVHINGDLLDLRDRNLKVVTKDSSLDKKLIIAKYIEARLRGLMNN